MFGKRRSVLILLLFPMLFLSIGFSCGDEDSTEDSSHGDDDDRNDDDDTFADDDVRDDDDAADDDDVQNDFKVAWDYVLLDGALAPPNPVTGAETPPEYNRIPVVRYRQDTGDDPPLPVDSIVILQAGPWQGLNNCGYIARNLVNMSEGKVEVWLVDRRTNLLEDQTGFDAAEAAKDPLIARDYYFNHKPINGQVFQGWIGSQSVESEMVSEWGIDLLFHDLRALIRQVPEESQQANVFLGSYSRGSRLSQMFAAYEFEDGTLGSDYLAGIILIDAGVATPRKMTENKYTTKLERIRSGLDFRFLLFDTIRDFTTWSLIYGMIASDGFGPADDPRFGPDGFWDDWGTYELLRILATRGHDVKLSNEAFFGLLFDDSSETNGFFYARLGHLTGGTIGHDFLGDFPSEDGAVYSWLSFDECNPEELVDIQKLFQMMYAGPSDYIDMYYTSRMTWDENMAGYLETEGNWRHKYVHYYTSLVDIPVYALAGFTSGTENYHIYRDRLAPVRGQDKPRTEIGFHIHEQPDWGHLEVLLVEPDRNPFLEDLLVWLDKWSEDQVLVPEFE